MENKNKREWVIVLLYSSLIYATLPLSPLLLSFLYRSFGKAALSFAVNGFFMLVILFLSIYFFKNSRDKYIQLPLISFVLISGGIMAYSYETPEERIHFLEYGVFGFMAFSASVNSGLRMPMLLSFLIASIIGIGDEAIQWFLPNRVGDIRDVFMNIIGGVLGISIYKIWSFKI